MAKFKKNKNAKFISTVLGMLLLLGGLGAGIVLVSEPQLLIQHAQTVGYDCLTDCTKTIGLNGLPYYCDTTVGTCKPSCLFNTSANTAPGGVPGRYYCSATTSDPGKTGGLGTIYQVVSKIDPETLYCTYYYGNIFKGTIYKPGGATCVDY